MVEDKADVWRCERWGRMTGWLACDAVSSSAVRSVQPNDMVLSYLRGKELDEPDLVAFGHLGLERASIQEDHVVLGRVSNGCCQVVDLWRD